MKTNDCCSFFVVVDIRRDGNYYYKQDSLEWIKNDYLNATHYDNVSDIPVFSIKVHFYKIHLIFECVDKELDTYANQED